MNIFKTAWGEVTSLMGKIAQARDVVASTLDDDEHAQMHDANEEKCVEEVFCTLSIEGTHSWPECPFDEVAYLRDEHRHMFGIKAFKQVGHSNRDVEFIMLKSKIQNYITNKYSPVPGTLCLFGSKSCEMLAHELIREFGLTRCEVDEDGENGAVVTLGVELT